MERIIKTNPFIRIDSDFDATNIVTNERFDVKSPKLIPFLDYMVEWKPYTSARKELCSFMDVSQEVSNNLLSEMLDNDIIITSESEYVSLIRQSRRWVDLGWQEELDYFLSVTDVMDDYRSSPGGSWIKRAWEGEQIPDIYKTYEQSETISLEVTDDPPLLNDIESTLLPDPRKSERESSRSLTKKDISKILHISFGETGEITVPRIARFIRRTSPSGGARHPTEPYIAVRDIQDIPEGLYHYSTKRSELEHLSTIDTEALQSHFWKDIGDQFSAVLLCSSKVERNMMKYKVNRCYSVILEDLGHILQTFRLVCRNMEYICEPIYGIDSSIHEHFSFDYYEEPIICGSVIR
jgi:SagB-type dehydrogenase family enzyme